MPRAADGILTAATLMRRNALSESAMAIKANRTNATTGSYLFSAIKYLTRATQRSLQWVDRSASEALGMFAERGIEATC